MAELKRDPIKYIRDKAKAKYEKGDACEICGARVKLDFHHFYTLAPLYHKWIEEKKKLRPEHYTDEYITIWRDEFIEDNWQELYFDTVTLCHEHHLKLHSIYGRNPGLHTAKKQMRWVEIQREKHGMV
jgi:transcription elongation factor Elf1